MALRDQFTTDLKTAMKAGDAPRVSTLRMILAKLKDTDIAARPKGVAAIPDDEVMAMLRGMVKSRRELVTLYAQGNRPELVAKEEAEIAVIEAFLPQQMDEAALAEAVARRPGRDRGSEHQGHGQGDGGAEGAARCRAGHGPRRRRGAREAGRLMALPPGFLEELRARTPLATVVGRRVRLARSGRQWKGNCPFHGEKTPSFYVYDDHYHCFGCGEHGDAIGFVMQSQGAGFMEAVEQLAGEAGHGRAEAHPRGGGGRAAPPRRPCGAGRGAGELPAAAVRARGSRGPRLPARPRADRGDDHPLRPRLVRRGPGRADRRTRRPGHSRPTCCCRPGCCAPPRTAATTELFFNRVMFPIRDRRGRTISFGGRTLGDAPPKYVNGPETDVFSKRRTLYALDLAREGVRGGAALVVVEGYMDVIALHQAGFAGAVAPLGTALTAEQLEEAWRLDPSPVLCFDGDAAGARAAARGAETALPLLAPDRSLRLARLPAGEDPDTLVRKQGRPVFEATLQAASPLADALYDLLQEAAPPVTPEQRAAFRGRLEALAKTIPHQALAGEYRSALLDRFFAERRPGQRRTGAKANGQRSVADAPAAPQAERNRRVRRARPGADRDPAAPSGAVRRSGGRVWRPRVTARARSLAPCTAGLGASGGSA